MLSKSSSLEVDEVVADLEDSVAVDAKESARDLVAAFLERAESLAPAVAVRINALAGQWGERDVLELVRRAGPQIGSLIVPKVTCAADLVAVERLLDTLGGRAENVALQALIENAAALERVSEIAAASRRLEAVILGYADLAASLGRGPAATTPQSWLYAQETVLVAARAHGLHAIDGPYLEIKDYPALRRWAEHVLSLGFNGKWAIHPSQIEVINATFTPSTDQLAQAHSILDALGRAEGRGAVELDGEMIDEASRKRALEVIARGRAAGVEGVWE
jgi:citrate lyase subunit beta/citryl-CoA lyase